MKVSERYDLKSYYISDNDVNLLVAIALHVANKTEIGDYQSCAFSMLVSRLKSRMESMNKEIKYGSF